MLPWQHGPGTPIGVSDPRRRLLKVVVADMPEWTRIGEQLTAADVGADRINTHVLLRKPKIFVGYPVRDRSTKQG
jgi:hypothetical protein